MKRLLPYMPQTYPTISTRVFKSFLAAIGPSVQKILNDQYGVEILDPMISSTFPLDRNRNEAAEKALSNPIEADYIFFADGDQIWPKDALPQLMAQISDDFPVVSGLYWRKAWPHVCVQGCYAGWAKHESKRASIEAMGFTDNGEQCLFYTPLKDFDVARRVDVAGMGCLLVQADIFRRIDLPYFGYFNSYSLGGDFTIDHASEEMLFFCKLKKAGVKTLLVPSVKCGHEVTKVIGSAEGEN